MEVFPCDAATVEVANAVGRNVGDFDFKQIIAGLHAVHDDPMGRLNERSKIAAVQPPLRVADLAQIEEPAFGRAAGASKWSEYRAVPANRFVASPPNSVQEISRFVFNVGGSSGPPTRNSIRHSPPSSTACPTGCQ